MVEARYKNIRNIQVKLGQSLLNKCCFFVEKNRLSYILYLTSFVFFSCNSESVPDCFQNAGDLTRVEVAVSGFDKITIFENLNLVVKQGDEHKVEIESGEFLINDISAIVEDEELILRNENGCNIFRDYNLSTIYVTSPNVQVIRSSTGGLISSDGVLSYPNVSLFSESFVNPEAETTDGSFDLELSSTTISILVNGIAYFKLNGTVEEFRVNIAAGDSRVEARDLISQNVILNHRGTNDIFVNPQQLISGVIRSYGDVISYNRPETIEVEELFEGRLIFQD